jgi:predicted alpha/beta superfamily hydrolase
MEDVSLAKTNYGDVFRFGVTAGVVYFLLLSSGNASAQRPCSSTVVGTLRIEQIQSAMYGDQRTLRIWLPQGYDASENAQKRYPVLYMFDGQTLFDTCTAFAGEGELQLDELLTRLIDQKAIPPMIVIGMDSSGRRSYEYSIYGDPISNPGAREPIGKQLPTFVTNEVIPFVMQHYRVTNEPTETGIGGTSLGAMAALYVLLQRPDRFALGLLQSPTVPLGNGEILRDTEYLGRGPDHVYIGVGGAELNGAPAEKFAVNLRMSLQDANAGFARMAEILAAHLKNASLNHSDVTFVTDPDGHHDTASWIRRMPAALIKLYGQRN